MAKKQTRRGVSLNRGLFDRIVAEAERDGITQSEWISRLARAELEKRGRPYNVQVHHVPRKVFDLRKRNNPRAGVRS